MKLNTKVTGITLSALTLLPFALAIQSATHAKTAPANLQTVAPGPINPNVKPVVPVNTLDELRQFFEDVDLNTLRVGKLRIEDGYGEFRQQLTSLDFHETSDVKLVWSENGKPFQAAEWRLFTRGKFLGSKNEMDIPLASGKIDHIVTDPNGRSSFNLKLKDYLTKGHLELYKDFWIQIYGQIESDDQFYMATNAVGFHWLGERKPPEPINPYTCNAAAGSHSRNVELSIPTMRVNRTSNTNGDGGRDELYLNVAQTGPGSHLDARIFPPQRDNYYTAKPGRTYGENLWIDKREDDNYKVSHPVLWRGHLSHGEKVNFVVRLQEQDNADITSIIKASTTVVDALGQVGQSVGGEWGAIIGGIGQSVNSIIGLIPLNSKHDYVGELVINAENQCGYIKTVWATVANNSGGMSASFQDTVSHQNAVVRMKALDDGTRKTLFGDYDFQEYDYVGTQDEFFYHANGTSNSSYSFLLRSRVLP